MSDTLSALIAFVGFLIVFSMLVQSVQEALKNLFKLKAGVWESFFSNLYITEFAYEKTKAPVQKSLWERVNSGDSIGDFERRLRRLHDVVTKAVTLLKNLRTVLSEIVLTDMSQPDAGRQILSKAGGLANVLRDVGGLKLDTLLSIYDKFNDGAITSFCKKLDEFEASYPGLFQPMIKIEDAAVVTFRDDCEKLLAAIEGVERKISDYRIQIETKIDSWLAQVNEEYRKNMLKWTVIIGLVFVVSFNADSFSVYKYLSIDSKAQELMLRKAADTTAITSAADANDLNTIMSAINRGQASDAKAAIIKMAGNMKNDFASFKDKEGEESAGKIAADTGKIDTKNTGESVKLLKESFSRLTGLYAGLQKMSIDYQLSGLAAVGLPLGWTADWNTLALSGGNAFLLLLIKKISGLALTTFLITFGAPFWNDILSALVGVKNMALRNSDARSTSARV